MMKLVNVGVLGYPYLYTKTQFARDIIQFKQLIGKRCSVYKKLI